MASGFVALLVIDLHLPESGSLKAKRRDLSSIKAQLHTRLGAAVAEVDHQDLWQRARLTAALTSGSLPTLRRRRMGSNVGSKPGAPLGSRCGE